MSTTPSSLSSTTSPVQVDSHSTLSSLKTMAQKAIDQAGIDITQESTDTKSNYNKLYAYIFSIKPYLIQIELFILCYVGVINYNLCILYLIFK